MRNYEMMTILDTEIDNDAREELSQKIESLITKNQGKIKKIDKLGKRRLAYEINHQKEGDYRVIYFQGEPERIAEIDRVMKITENVIRHGIFRLPDAEEKG